MEEKSEKIGEWEVEGGEGWEGSGGVVVGESYSAINA